MWTETSQRSIPMLKAFNESEQLVNAKFPLHIEETDAGGGGGFDGASIADDNDDYIAETINLPNAQRIVDALALMDHLERLSHGPRVPGSNVSDGTYEYLKKLESYDSDNG